MACPTCGQELEKEYPGEDGWMAHCLRCGTLVSNDDLNGEFVYVPQLVERCRAFQAGYADNGTFTPARWTESGIAESIHPPGDRHADQ